MPDATDEAKKVKVLYCSECNTPLIPGSTSCIKCKKQFSKPTPKIMEPRSAPPPSMPSAVASTPVPPRNVFDPRNKTIAVAFLVFVCLAGLVTFVITQSQADKRQAIAAEQAHQQALQHQAQLQQAPPPIAVPPPIVMKAAERPFQGNSLSQPSLSPQVDGATNGTGNDSSDNNQQNADDIAKNATDGKIKVLYSDGQVAYSTAQLDISIHGADYSLDSIAKATTQIKADEDTIQSLMPQGYSNAAASYQRYYQELKNDENELMGIYRRSEGDGAFA